MVSLHTYELFFFGAFVFLIAVFVVPKLGKLIQEYATKQKKEYSKLQNTRVSFLEEYKKEELNSKAAEQKWRKFTTHEAKLLKTKTEEAETEQNRLKLIEVRRHEEKLLEELLVAKRGEILTNVLIQTSAELSKMTQEAPESFSDQVAAIGEYFHDASLGEKKHDS